MNSNGIPTLKYVLMAVLMAGILTILPVCGGFLHSIDVDGIAEITLGACADKELLEGCLSFAKQNRKCCLFQASIHAYADKLNYERVNVS